MFVSLHISAQISGTVVNQENKPIQFTNIWVLDGSDGATTDSLGMFTIPTALAKDTLVFNASGYEILKEEAQNTEHVMLQAYEIPQPALIRLPENICIIQLAMRITKICIFNREMFHICTVVF